MARYMEKIEFAKWVEGPEVKGKFQVGDYVTYADTPVFPDRLPSSLMLVDHIQEIAFMAPLDVDKNEPKCVGVKMNLGGVVSMYPPKKLRTLTDEEKRLVHLRNSKTRTTPTSERGSGGNPPAETGATETAERVPKTEYVSAVVNGQAVLINKQSGEIEHPKGFDTSPF